MATRPRTPTFRTQPSSVRRVYDTLQPSSEMKETPQAFLLHVYLPGYTRDRIKITFVGSSRVVRITGERPIQGNNRWSRFDKTYPVPENCEAEALEGKFDMGTLVLTMPKKKSSISQVNEENTQEEEQNGDKKKRASELNAKKATPKEDTSSSSSQRPIEETQKPKTLNPQKEQKDDEKPSKREDEIEVKARLVAMKKQLQETTTEEKEKRISRDVKEQEGKSSENGMIISKEKEIRTKKVSPEVVKKEKEYSQNMVDGIREVASSVVTRIREGELNDEEKHLMANMGAALLVIAALGAYLSYKFAAPYSP